MAKETLTKKIMDFAEEIDKQNGTLCRHNIQQRFPEIKKNSLGGMMTLLWNSGGLSRKMGTCKDSDTDHYIYSFNKKPERTPTDRQKDESKSMTRQIALFAKDKAETKNPYFCVHDINKFLRIDVKTSTTLINKLEQNGYLTHLFDKSTCEFYDKVHYIYRYSDRKKPVLKGLPAPEPEKPVKEAKKKSYLEKVIDEIQEKKSEKKKPVEKDKTEPLVLDKIADYKRVEIVIESGKITIKAEK